MRFSWRSGAAILALVLAACSTEQKQITIVNPGGGGSGGTTAFVDSLKGTPSLNLSLKAGNCTGTIVNVAVNVFPSTTAPDGTWSAADGVASVISTGPNTAQIMGLKAGTETITYRHSGTGKTLPFKVTVTACDTGSNGGGTDNSNIVVTISPPGDAHLIAGQNYQLFASVAPSSVSQSVTWSSSDQSKVVISTSGLVTAIAVGSSRVCATSAVNTTKQACITIFVDATTGTGGSTTITISPTTGSGKAGTTLQLTFKETGTSGGVIWFSTDPSRVAVNQTTGLITYVYLGTAQICAQSKLNSSIKACGTYTTSP